MKLEPAQRLNWPWVTEKVFCLNDAGEYEVVSSQDCKHAFYRKPSVEEMLERMPESTCTEKRNFDTGYRAFNREIVKAGHHFGDTPDEALALLGIWLRDKKLMEWIYKEGEK